MSITVLTKNFILAKKKPNAVQREGWKRPPEGNVDAAFDVDSGRGAIGVIIRDYTGQFVAARNMFSPHVVDAPMAESLCFQGRISLSPNYWK
jgi:hypothetical protein